MTGAEHPVPLPVADGIASDAYAEAVRPAEAKIASALLLAHHLPSRERPLPRGPSVSVLWSGSASVVPFFDLLPRLEKGVGDRLG